MPEPVKSVLLNDLVAAAADGVTRAHAALPAPRDFRGSEG
jgi:hypothetical protein